MPNIAMRVALLYILPQAEIRLVAALHLWNSLLLEWRTSLSLIIGDQTPSYFSVPFCFWFSIAVLRFPSGCCFDYSLFYCRRSGYYACMWFYCILCFYLVVVSCLEHLGTKWKSRINRYPASYIYKCINIHICMYIYVYVLCLIFEIVPGQICQSWGMTLSPPAGR